MFNAALDDLVAVGYLAPVVRLGIGYDWSALTAP